MTPTRVQRSRAKGAKLPFGTLCCTRPGKWSNPFRVVKIQPGKWRVHTAVFQSKESATKYAVDSYRTLVNTSPGMFDFSELRKYKHLACWCALDAPCHVDILIEKLTKP